METPLALRSHQRQSAIRWTGWSRPKHWAGLDDPKSPVTRALSRRDFRDRGGRRGSGATGRVFARTPIGGEVVPDFNLTIIASRSSGEVEFGVVFSIVGNAVPDGGLLHDCFHSWTAVGSASVTAGEGFNFAALYDTAGIYTVTASVYTPAGLFGYGTFTVTASPYSGASRYVDAVNGNDAWDGTSGTFVSGTTGPWATIGAGITWLGSNSNRRLLVKSGTTYTQSSDWLPSSSSNVRIGWYGGSVRPIIDRGFGVTGGRFASTNNCSDITIAHVQLRGATFGSWSTGVAANASNKAFQFNGYDDICVWDCVADGWGQGIDSQGGDQTLNKVLTVFDSTIQNIGDYGVIHTARNNDNSTSVMSAWVNLTIQNTAQQAQGHSFRTGALRYAWFWNFVVTNANAEGAVKLNSSGNSGNNISDFVWIGRGCSFGGGPNSDGFCLLDIGQQNTSSDQWVRNFVVDGVLFPGVTGDTEATGIQFRGQDITIRNCAFYPAFSQAISVTTNPALTLAEGGFQIIGCSARLDSINPRLLTWSSGVGVGVNITKNKVKNCAAYSNTGSSISAMIDMRGPGDAGLTDLEDSNNMAKWPAASGGLYIRASSDYTFTSPPSGHGGSSAYDDPEFTSSTNLRPSSALSPLVGAGLAIGQHTRIDLAGTARGASVDIGAYEFTA